MSRLPGDKAFAVRGTSYGFSKIAALTSLVAILFGCHYALAQTRLTTQTPGDEHIKQLLQTLEPDDTLRIALEHGARGDGVHYSWMDTMRKFGIKQASFVIHFQSAAGRNDLKLTVTDIKYLLHYYRYDAAVTDASTIKQIRGSGLEEILSSEIQNRSKIFLTEQNYDLGLASTCGTLYVNLLDDEVLPILDEPADRVDCNSNGASARERQTVRLTSKRLEPTITSRPTQGRVLDEETYDKVLDLVFPRSVLKDQKFRYAFVLRYEPSFQAESQITIAEREGKVEVLRYTALDGSIELKLNKVVQRTHQQNPQSMAKQIRIKKETLNLSLKDLKLLHDSFFDKLRQSEKVWLDPPKNEIMIASDGTSYRVWYRGETDVQTDFIGSNITTPTRRDESPLIDWMKGVYLKVTLSATAHR